MKRLFILFLLFISVQAHGQIKKNRPVFWVTPSIDTRINGLASGFIINSLKDVDSTLTTEINGLNIELIGVGFFLPLAPTSPLYFEKASFYDDSKNVDSIVGKYDFARYRINGVSISFGGLGGHDINVNGVNLSVINTLTGKINGLSACILINVTGVANGVTIGGLINNTIQTNGLQIGLLNKTTKLRGFQIGLWNQNEKRSLPLINWNLN